MDPSQLDRTADDMDSQAREMRTQAANLESTARDLEREASNIRSEARALGREQDLAVARARDAESALRASGSSYRPII